MPPSDSSGKSSPFDWRATAPVRTEQERMSERAKELLRAKGAKRVVSAKGDLVGGKMPSQVKFKRT